MIVHHGMQNRWSLPRGRVLRRALRSDPTQEYLLYVPHSAGPDARVLVSVHGISRNAHEQAAVFSPMCEERGVVMLAPIFDPDQHEDYQRLGRRGRGQRVDLLLHDFLVEVSRLTGADVSQTYLFGFSGGAQFVHRYVMAHPHRVAKAVVAAAGWYTFPDHGQRFAYGIRPVRTLEGVVFNPEEFLRVPMEVLVGSLDTGNQNLRRTERVDAQQGATRLDRARNWVSAMREAAVRYALPPVVTLTEVAGIDHSFSEFCERGGLVQHVGTSLFGESTEEDVLQFATSRVGSVNGDTSTHSNGDSSRS